METTTESTSSMPPGPRLVSRNEYKEHTYEVHMHDADAFSFAVHHESAGVSSKITESAPDFESTNRAEMAAERWISDRIAGAQATDVGGWRITILPDRNGTFQAAVFSVDEDGARAPEDFKGYLDRAKCHDEAMTWAAKHPRGSLSASPPPTSDEPEVELEAEPKAQEPQAAAVEPVASEAPARLREVASMLSTPVRRPHVNEATGHAQEHALLVTAIAALEEELKALKADIGAKKMRLQLLGKKMSDALLGLSQGTQTTLPLSAPEPSTPPFGSTPAAGDAAQLAADRLKPTTESWAFNGREHAIEVREVEEGRWRAALRGHADDTEGFGETRDQALEAAKARASIVFADCDPGETTPSADAGPVADGVKLPPRRGRKPKLAGKSVAEVEQALRQAMTLSEAATAIGCTEGELEDYARRVDLRLSEHLGRNIGEDEPAPTSKSTKAKNLANIVGRGKKRGRK